MSGFRLGHAEIWAAIDRLAAKRGLSPSGLAKMAGLDPTAFNLSKRSAPGGKDRWPSTESLAKVLNATKTSFADFVTLVDGHGAAGAQQRIPVIGLAQAGERGFFDDGGHPVGQGWNDLMFADTGDDGAYALTISGDSMEPVYRPGDTIVVSPTASLRRGDRVVVKTRDGEVMAKELGRRGPSRIELVSLNPEFPPRGIDVKNILWMHRIIWASQ